MPSIRVTRKVVGLCDEDDDDDEEDDDEKVPPRLRGENDACEAAFLREGRASVSGAIGAVK